MKTLLSNKRIVILGIVLVMLSLLTAQVVLANPEAVNNFLDAADGAPTKAVWVDNDGRVGIGTQGPTSNLHISGPSDQSIDIASTNALGSRTRLMSVTSNGATESQMQFRGKFTFISPLPGDGTTKGVLTLLQTGKVGIGTTTPIGNLHVAGAGNQSLDVSTTDAVGSYTKLMAVSSNGVAESQMQFRNQFSFVAPLPTDGTAKEIMKLNQNGTVSVPVLQITGGSDLAENFQGSDFAKPEPGSVMVIDEKQEGKLKLSTTAYDRKVAGIVSGAGSVKTGLTLQQDNVLDGDLPVTVVGRVYCKAEALTSAIQPGDLLTTSTVPGYCMKASDNARANGAIIGKAMSGLKSGKGLILVLVNLQ